MGKLQNDNAPFQYRRGAFFFADSNSTFGVVEPAMIGVYFIY